VNNYDELKEQTTMYFKEIHGNFANLFNTNHFYIAGGAIRDFVLSCQEPKDYDIFVNSISLYSNIAESLMANGYTMVEERKNSTVFEKENGCVFDVVFVEDSSPMDDFDLVCCTAQYGPNGLEHHPDFFKDVINQEININKLKLPYNTFKRIAKHIRKGYTVEPDILVKVMDYAVKETEENMDPKSSF